MDFIPCGLRSLETGAQSFFSFPLNTFLLRWSLCRYISCHPSIVLLSLVVTSFKLRQESAQRCVPGSLEWMEMPLCVLGKTGLRACMKHASVVDSSVLM